MSNMKGDLKLFSSRQIQLLCKVLEELKLSENEVIIEPLGKPGDNILSDIKIARINNENTNIFNLIIKLTSFLHSTENPISNMSNIAFNNEILMYNDVLKTMDQLQRDFGVAAKDKLKMIKCYGAISDRSNEMILLEYIPKDYIMFDKFEPLSHEAVQQVLKNLAMYHSFSYIIKDKWPKLYNEYCAKLVSVYEVEENIKNASLFGAFGNDFCKIFDDLKYRNICKQSFMQHFEEMIKLNEADKKSKHSVIIHGDCWTNNVLFRLTEGVPYECILIDYQLSREARPAADVLNLIFNCTDFKTRSESYNIWIDYYHEQLKNSLNNYGIMINEFYPREMFDVDLKRYSKAYLGFAIFSANTVLRETNESAIVRDSLSKAEEMTDLLDTFKIGNLNTSTLNKIRNKVIGLIDSCIELGYINDV